MQNLKNGVSQKIAISSEKTAKNDEKLAFCGENQKVNAELGKKIKKNENVS